MSTCNRTFKTIFYTIFYSSQKKENDKVSKKLVDHRHRYRKLTKQQLLDVADEIKYRRFPDGKITGIDIFKRKALIHQSIAFYVTKDKTLHLSRVTGKFQQEIFNSWISRQARLAWYDRNSKTIYEQYTSLGKVPHSVQTRFSYEVPQARLFFLEFISAKIMRSSIATTVGQVRIDFDYKVAGGTSKTFLMAILETNNIGDKNESEIGQSMILFQGDIIQARTLDASTGGNVHYRAALKGTEFDF